MWVVVAAASMGCGGAAQGRLEAEVFEGAPADVSPDALKTVFRLIRAGSGVERVELRRRLAMMGPKVVAPLRNELGSGNHLFACQAALVFAAMRAEGTVPSLRAVVEGRLRGEPISAAVAGCRSGATPRSVSGKLRPLSARNLTPLGGAWVM